MATGERLDREKQSVELNKRRHVKLKWPTSSNNKTQPVQSSPDHFNPNPDHNHNHNHNDRLNFLPDNQAEDEDDDDENCRVIGMFNKRETNKIDNLNAQVYNAIKLTNYYTNLLFNKQQCDSIKQQSTTGASWRSKQLAFQIPQQDIKLLASANGPSTAADFDALPKSQDEKPRSSQGSQGADEIEFIRGQRKAASQFKASLYYLNPVHVAAQKQRNGPPTTSWLRGGALNQSASNQVQKQNAERQAKQHCCFKVSLMTSINALKRDYKHTHTHLSSIEKGKRRDLFSFSIQE